MSGYGYYEFPANITVTAHSAEQAAKEIESLALPDTIAITKMNAHDLKRPYKYDFFPIQDEEIDSLWTCPECEESLLENGIVIWDMTSADMKVTFRHGNPDEPDISSYEGFGDIHYTFALHCQGCNKKLPLEQAIRISHHFALPLHTVTGKPIGEANAGQNGLQDYLNDAPDEKRGNACSEEEN